MRRLRKILYPFSLIYGAVTGLRNLAYTLGLLKSTSYGFPIIGIGNLSTGGTGKSPMVEYIVGLLDNKSRVAVLSRGYGRKSKGFKEVLSLSTALEVGDEPLQFKTKFPQMVVAVDADRRNGIDMLLTRNPAPEILVLDDVFQHRRVKPGLLILLSSFDSLFHEDFLLPAGNLRESRSGASRADVVVITKCPISLSRKQMETIKREVGLFTAASIYFTTISYDPYVFGESQIPLIKFLDTPCTLVTGIANPKPFTDYLSEKGLDYKHLSYPDHHNFTTAELLNLDALPLILTTEKDYMRLKPLLRKAKLFYLPIRHEFILGSEAFSVEVLGYLKSGRNQKQP